MASISHLQRRVRPKRRSIRASRARLVLAASSVCFVVLLPLLARAQPGSLFYEGQLHTPLGSADLVAGPGGGLAINNLGSTGKDGVEISLDRYPGGASIATSVQLDSIPVGASFGATAIGSDGSGALVELATAELTATSPTEFVLSGGGLGTIRVLFGGQVVHEEPGESFGFSRVLSGPLHLRAIRVGDETSLRLSVACGVIRHRWLGGMIIGDAIEFSQVEPCLGLPEECESLGALHITAGGLGSFTLGEETVFHLGSGFSGSGGAVLSAGVDATGQSTVRADNLGSSGQDGVSVRYRTLMSECSVEWTPPVPDNPAVPGTTLTIGSRGMVDGNDALLGSLTLVDVGGSLVCTPDYSPIGATSHLVQVYDGGVEVASFPGLVMPSIEIAGQEFPRGCGKLNQWPLLCLWSEWETARQFTVGGAAVVGDELRVIAQGSVEVVAISELSLSTVGISSLELLAAGGTSFVFPHRPPPLDYGVDRTTGHVVSRWQASIVYTTISAVVTDDSAQTTEVYSLPGSATEVDLGRLTANGRVEYKFCFGQDLTVNPAETYRSVHRLHGGMNHFALGDAQLDATPDGLTVSNIGSSGQDGVSIAISDLAGVEISTLCELPLMPVGSSAQFRTRGETTFGDVVVVRELDGVSFVPSDDTGAPVAYTLRAFLGDFPALEVGGTSGATPIGLLLPAVQNIRYAPTWSGDSLVHTFHILDGYAQLFGLGPDQLSIIDRLEFEVDSPLGSLEPVTHVEITGNGFPWFVIGEAKQKPNPPILSVPTTSGGTIPHGAARVVGTAPTSGPPALRVENLGSSGKDGVSVDFGLSSDCAIDFEPIEPAPGVAGATLVVGATGSVAGESAFLGSVAIVDQGSSLTLTPDYSPIGATSYHIGIFQGGALMASLPGLPSPAIEVLENVFPPRCGKLNQWPLLCLWFEWSSARTILVDGVGYTGDEIRVIAEGSVEVLSISALELSATGIPELSITHITSVLYDIPEITDVVATIDPTDGHVIVSWTNPVTYRAADLVVGGEVFPLGSPAPSQVDLGLPSPDLGLIWIKLFFEKHCVVIEIDVPLLLSKGGDPTFTRGDANADSQVNIADSIFLLSYLFTGGAAPSCQSSGDANDDGALNIGDPIYLLTYLFSGGPPPPSPFAACATDPTADGLNCATPTCTP